jgi:hypothetical protein
MFDSCRSACGDRETRGSMLLRKRSRTEILREMAYIVVVSVFCSCLLVE